MALQMKPECEKCHQMLPANGIAMICSYECSFCEKCAAEMKNVCPNCGGELVQRSEEKVRKYATISIGFVLGLVISRMSRL